MSIKIGRLETATSAARMRRKTSKLQMPGSIMSKAAALWLEDANQELSLLFA